MKTVRTGTDAWTYYEFGARSLHDDITALIVRDLDDGIDGDAVEPDLREQSTGRTFPVIPVLAIDVALNAELANTKSVSRVAQLLLLIKRNEDAITVAYLRQHPELLSKIRDRIAREIAADLIEAVFYGGSLNYRVAVPGEFVEGVETGSPDR